MKYRVKIVLLVTIIAVPKKDSASKDIKSWNIPKNVNEKDPTIISKNGINLKYHLIICLLIMSVVMVAYLEKYS